MSDFPIGGDSIATRAWLDKKGFRNVFNGFEAESIMGLDKDDIISMVSGDNGLRLWGLLNTAKNNLHMSGNFNYFIFKIFSIFIFYFLFFSSVNT